MGLGLLAAITISSCGQEQTISKPKSICGSTNDLQDVLQYDGSLGVSTNFVANHQSHVGIIIDSENRPFCSGTLISDNLFLTAGHCISAGPAFVVFDYQLGVESSDWDFHAVVGAPVENGFEMRGSLDFAILELEDSPGTGIDASGNVRGFANVSTSIPSRGSTVTIIQHPAGEQKKVEAGQVSGVSGNFLLYSSLDTLGGSSGSGVLDRQGRLISVHTNGGCSASGGSNRGVTISSISRVSSIL